MPTVHEFSLFGVCANCTLSNNCLPKSISHVDLAGKHSQYESYDSDGALLLMALPYTHTVHIMYYLLQKTYWIQCMCVCQVFSYWFQGMPFKFDHSWAISCDFIPYPQVVSFFSVGLVSFCTTKFYLLWNVHECVDVYVLYVCVFANTFR